MANSAPSEASDFDTKIIAEFRANQGRVGGPLAGTPMILIHHTGAQAHAGIGDEVAAILVGHVAPRAVRIASDVHIAGLRRSWRTEWRVSSWQA
jgi:hypothetical protein